MKKGKCIICHGKFNNKSVTLTNGICSIKLCIDCGQQDIEVSRNNWYPLYIYFHDLGFKHKGKTYVHEIDGIADWLKVFNKKSKYADEIGYKYLPSVKVVLDDISKKHAKNLSGKAIAKRVNKIKGILK